MLSFIHHMCVSAFLCIEAIGLSTKFLKYQFLAVTLELTHLNALIQYCMFGSNNLSLSMLFTEFYSPYLSSLFSCIKDVYLLFIYLRPQRRTSSEVMMASSNVPPTSLLFLFGEECGQHAARKGLPTLHITGTQKSIFIKKERGTSLNLHSLIFLTGNEEQHLDPTYPCPIGRRVYLRSSGVILPCVSSRSACLNTAPVPHTEDTWLGFSSLPAHNIIIQQ